MNRTSTLLGLSALALVLTYVNLSMPVRGQVWNWWPWTMTSTPVAEPVTNTPPTAPAAPDNTTGVCCVALEWYPGVTDQAQCLLYTTAQWVAASPSMDAEALDALCMAAGGPATATGGFDPSANLLAPGPDPFDAEADPFAQ